MFYTIQPLEQKIEYKKMLTIIGNLTLLFSESACPYLPYRAHENIFCKYFKAENLARFDCSADAKKENIGIGLKTWMGGDDQKVAEFGRLRETYKNLAGIELVKKVSEYRNERIRVTKNMYDIDKMIYHIVKRIPNAMQIIECAFDYIDIENISVIKDRGNVNNTYFNDKKHTYHFSISKNTLYMIFDDFIIVDEFAVEIMADPYAYLMNISDDIKEQVLTQKNIEDKLCLRLYSSNKKQGKFVAERSGLNQWNALGRKRNPNELYIPFPVEDRKRSKGFFPLRKQVFKLQMPDGTIIPSKVCQDDGKAIMSNPNKILGEWLLRKVFEIPEGTTVTYDMLEKFGVDCVVFTKIDENNYKIDFADIGTYEEFTKGQNHEE
ncbi:MAG: NgoFVII family restriction endonuclease [Oscillospiraceae bacterium]